MRSLHSTRFVARMRRGMMEHQVVLARPHTGHRELTRLLGAQLYPVVHNAR